MSRPARRPARPYPAPSIPADKLPPHSVEAEQGALGCLLWPDLSAKAALEMLATLPAHWCYDLRHQTILKAVLHVAQGGALDLILVRQRLKDEGQLAGVGGVAYLTSLADSTPSPYPPAKTSQPSTCSCRRSSWRSPRCSCTSEP